VKKSLGEGLEVLIFLPLVWFRLPRSNSLDRERGMTLRGLGIWARYLVIDLDRLIGEFGERLGRKRWRVSGGRHGGLTNGL
jgi:hypothetical protein